MESWHMRIIAPMAIIVLLFGVFLVDAFGPDDFEAVAYVTPLLVALGGLVANEVIRSGRNQTKDGEE